MSLDKVLLDAETQDEFLKQLMGSLALATRTSNSLPKGLDHKYSLSHPSFVSETNAAAEHSKALIGDLLKFCNVTPVQGPLPDDVSDPYLYDLLVDAVDGLLEQADRFLSASVPANSYSEIAKNTLLLDKERVIAESCLDLPKPQVAWLPLIDNSIEHPFRPRMQTKYHALVPYVEARGRLEEEDEEEEQVCGPALCRPPPYAHPYERELAALQVPQHVLEAAEPAYPSERQPIFIDSVPAWDDMLTALADAREIALDLEHHALRSFQGMTCLMQISSRSADYVIDVLALWEHIPRLGLLLANPAQIKIVHGSAHDILWLQRDFSLYIVGLFDTFDAAKGLGLEGLSYAALVSYYAHVNLSKACQLADWRQRPLPADMLAYAAADTHYLLYVYDCLRRDLLADTSSGVVRLEAALLASRKRCLAVFEKPVFRPQGYRAVLKRARGVASTPSAVQEGVLAALWRWRDEVARREDEAVSWVMGNAELLRIGLRTPRTLQELLATTSGVLSAYPRQHPEEVLAVIADALRAQALPLCTPVLSAAPAAVVPVPGPGPTPPRRCGTTVFTFTPRILTMPSAPPGVCSPVLETEQMFRMAGWASPTPSPAPLGPSASTSSGALTPLLDQALLLHPMGAIGGGGRGEAMQRALQDLQSLLDPTLRPSTSSGVQIPVGSVLGTSEEVLEAEDEEVLSVPQSLQEVYALAGASRKRRKARAEAEADGGIASTSTTEEVQQEGFNFPKYFEENTSSEVQGEGEGLDGTLALIQAVGWARTPEEVQALRDEATAYSTAEEVQQQPQQATPLRRSFEKPLPLHPGGGAAAGNKLYKSTPSGVQQFSYPQGQQLGAMGALPQGPQAQGQGQGQQQGRGRGGGGGGRGGAKGRGAGRGQGNSSNPYLYAFAPPPPKK